MNKMYSFFLACFFALSLGNAQAQIVISELNYQSDSTVNSGDWVELWNPTGSAVDVSNWKMIDGNLTNFPYTIPPGTTIPADGRLVLVDNVSRFTAQHPGVTSFLGPLGFEFANSGELVTLSNAAGQIQVQFQYDDSIPWNKCADGFGRTLELLDPAVAPSNASNWRCGCIKGSPGTAFVPCTNETLLISEINYKSLPTQEAGDWIEIWNKTNGSLNLSGYKFRDDNNSHIYNFPSGTILNPQERIVVFNDAINFTIQHPGVTRKVGPFNFSLDGNGDAVRLYNSSDRLIQSLWYDDDGNWPTCADGEGATLELVTDFDQPRDISDYSSWRCGCPKGSPAAAFVNTCGVGIGEVISTNTFRVWPNPASDVLYFEAQSGNATFHIVSVDGKTIKSGSLNGTTQQIDVADLPSGIYVISIAKDGEVLKAKWIKN